MNEAREPIEIALTSAGEATTGGIIQKVDSKTAKSLSEEEEKDNKTGEASSIHRQQSIVPIVTVSGSSPTPPSSPLPLLSKESSITIVESHSAETHISDISNANAETMSAATSLLSIPSAIEAGRGSGFTLVKQLSESQVPSMSSSSSHISVPLIKRQHSQPNPGEISNVQAARLLYPGMKPGDLFQIVPAQDMKDDGNRSEGIYYVDSSLLQVIPTTTEPIAGSRRISESREVIKDMEIIRRDVKRDPEGAGASFDSNQSIDESEMDVEKSSKSSDTVQTYGHCPSLRPGPALGCNFCWNSVDKCGRILRRKTKYHCKECKINLCIVPCFQQFHARGESSDVKKPKRNLLPKPSSM